MVNARLLRMVLVLMTAGTAFCAAASDRPTVKQIESWIIARPSPDYPAEALARRETGSGVVKVHFKVKTGTVRTIQVIQSTGHKALDAAAVKAFNQWRFRAGVLPSIRQVLTVVPPISNETARSIPISRVSAAAANTPAAGPDSTR